MSITISTELQEWLKKNKSRSVQAGVDTDFNRSSYQITRKSAAPVIEDDTPGAANVEEP